MGCGSSSEEEAISSPRGGILKDKQSAVNPSKKEANTNRRKSVKWTEEFAEGGEAESAGPTVVQVLPVGPASPSSPPKGKKSVTIKES